ncbi:alpha/beta hydrolase [Mycolicibacterium sp. YH-1]|uniref:alpha/beta hydrolase n=1 Tax=Mycolicibacterium sp. YH-1 TaxID=2908837 RepID=UPI00352CF801
MTVRAFRAFPARRRRSPEDVEVVTLPSGIGLRVHRPPQGGSGSGLLWIHGGGYVLGDAAMDDSWCQRHARELATTVVAVDYRLAPAHPFPAPLHDCYDALRWLAAQSTIDPTRIAVAGASAGGGLAAALALLARDRGEIALAAQILVYPMLDDRTAARHDTDAALRRLWNNSSNRLGWRAYLNGANPNIAVPARCGDLRRLPATWLGVGTLDVLYGESTAYAHRLQAAEVDCELKTVPGAFHGFDAVAPKTAVTADFLLSQREFLRRALACP